ncbi:amidohydrolase family protein [Methylogaea oryzae]|uniref:Xaa-Pro dipeptidase n=1 Tax=Methylogaea oryzae TaxID=1295382 RepID=A0A8D5AH68_9GAMM|nr:amidohydrolase family protein [Methylogaea oryzae]BBL71158.1 Xaa-Pro dipeptidase [Methylogaea oryzae]
MKSTIWNRLRPVAIAAAFALAACAAPPQPVGLGGAAVPAQEGRLLLLAARVFDGQSMRQDAGVLIAGRDVVAVGSAAELRGQGAREMDLGDATILPGFIELHAHLAFHRIPADVVLRHGITTVRDVGGPLLAASGGDGRLRLLSAGPILTAPGGYPIATFGDSEVAVAVRGAEEARRMVGQLVEGGAAVIKIALEPGGEPGAPWNNTGHGHGHGGGRFGPPWPLLPPEVVKAAVEEAHRLGRKVAAHVGESRGVELSLDAGVDEWAHIPCAAIGDGLLRRAVEQGVKVVSTLDTLSGCAGAHANAMALAKLGADFLYGAEIAHTDVPWGIDAQELHWLRQLSGMSTQDLFRTVTAKAGAYLGLAPLGTLTPGAPADFIAVRGDPQENLKLLEYPDLVVSGGRVVANGHLSVTY